MKESLLRRIDLLYLFVSYLFFIMTAMGIGSDLVRLIQSYIISMPILLVGAFIVGKRYKKYIDMKKICIGVVSGPFIVTAIQFYI